jgi:hypothetical protein
MAPACLQVRPELTRVGRLLALSGNIKPNWKKNLTGTNALAYFASCKDEEKVL